MVLSKPASQPSTVAPSTTTKPKKTKKTTTTNGFVRKLKNAADRTNKEPTKMIDFEEQMQKTIASKERAAKRKREKEQAAQLALNPDAIKKIEPPKPVEPTISQNSADSAIIGDDCEDDEFDMGPVIKGSASRLIANLERLYASGYVEGYDFADDWIDDSTFCENADPVQEEEDKLQDMRTEYEGFYVHQGDIKYVPKESPKSKKPPKKKRKLTNSTSSVPTQ